MAETSIEWTDRVWNPVRGCSLVSQGCKNCYAMKQAHRFNYPGGPYEGLTVLNSTGPTWTGKVVCDESKLQDPLHWRKPARIFVNSMSDLFHGDVPDRFIASVFGVMFVAHWHTFQVLNETGTDPDGSTRIRLDQLPRQAQLAASGPTAIGGTAETASTGQLNPEYSRWLMGLPIEWSNCADTAMRSWRRAPKRS